MGLRFRREDCKCSGVIVCVCVFVARPLGKRWRVIISVPPLAYSPSLFLTRSPRACICTNSMCHVAIYSSVIVAREYFSASPPFFPISLNEYIKLRTSKFYHLTKVQGFTLNGASVVFTLKVHASAMPELIADGKFLKKVPKCLTVPTT